MSVTPLPLNRPRMDLSDIRLEIESAALLVKTCKIVLNSSENPKIIQASLIYLMDDLENRLDNAKFELRDMVNAGDQL